MRWKYIKKKVIQTSALIGLMTLASACSSQPAYETIATTEWQGDQTESEPETLTVEGTDASLETEEEAAPEYLRIGVRHSVVAMLQERLMELGFMDNDEPTNYFGETTKASVMKFQRQYELNQDGVVGPATFQAIMSPDAKYYMVENGVSGDDIYQIQQRLYELGYLATADQLTGNFGDATEAAVKKLQSVNGLTEDGKVGKQTFNLLYSDEIKPNMLAYGEKSDVVLASQKRLRELGYLTSEPDGTYGADTVLAVKQFQSRNDQVVDGYLGPSTRAILNSGSAVANGLRLGDDSVQVTKIQQLLSKYGYLYSGNVTGYYGELTENAVKSFQKTNGLVSDGIAGVATITKLSSSDVKKASRPSTSSQSGTRGNSGGGGSKNNSGGGKNNSGGSGGGGSTVSVAGGASRLVAVAKSKVGSSYVWGAKGPNTFDCSGFVYWCLNNSGVKQSYLTSSGWRSPGRYTKITNFNSLQAGDIVVVNGHVGIAAGGGMVVDASSGNGKVVYRSLSSWWRSNFICGWRIFG
ncbi:MAG: peptidoglycan-binding protein [bacterium]|nr:peptidoglycan-binding protein [bacterium]